jgi:DNA-binding beta-propeller fold protein YncE
MTERAANPAPLRAAGHGETYSGSHPARSISSSASLAFWLLLCSCATSTPLAPGPPAFSPPAPEEPRLQSLTSYTSEADLTGPISTFERFLLGDRSRSFESLNKPYGVAIHDGRIFVCDTRDARVRIFDLVGRSMESMGQDEHVRLKTPINITIDRDGTRYVADTGHRRLIVFDEANRYAGAIGDPNAWSPSDVAIYQDRLYVADVLNGQVVVMDKESGRELGRIAQKGELRRPTNVAVDVEGNVYVTDTLNFRILKFDRTGELLNALGSVGRGPGLFVRPKGIAVDREKRLYVVDAGFENVQIFDSEGRALAFFGGPTNNPGGLKLPAKVAIDYDNVGLFEDRTAPGHRLEYLVLVTSQFGSWRVNVYGFFQRPAGVQDP